MIPPQFAGSLFRALLLVSAAAAHHISSTPPSLANQTPDRLVSGREQKENASNKHDDKIHGPVLLNKIGMTLVRMSPYTVWLMAIIEMAVRLASIFPSSSTASTVIQVLSPYSPAPTALVAPMTTVYFAACIAVYIGYRIRTSCFATLGRHFTFTHTTLAQHQLVKDGPYSVVRHASYSGEILVRGGIILMLICPGSWAYEFGIVGSGKTNMLLADAFEAFDIGSVFALLAGWLLVFHVCWATFNTSFLIWRSSLEDATLKEKFGAEWEAYRKQVPYKFIPFVV